MDLNSTNHQSSSNNLEMKYEEQFPPLPSSGEPLPKPMFSNNKLRFQSANSTAKFTVPLNERKYTSELTQNSQKKVCESIAQKCGVSIELNCNKDQNLTVFITGIPEKVQNAKKLLSKELQTQIHCEHKVPKDYHKFILGAKGATLKSIENNSCTNINIPRANDNSEIVVITGTKDGIEKAKTEINNIVMERSKLATERITIPKKCYPFICGPNSSKLNDLRNRTGARINIPPIASPNDEIVISGERDGVYEALRCIKEIYEDITATAQDFELDVPSWKLRYVVGKGGSGITDILERANVSVTTDDKREKVIFYGPREKLPNALHIVIVKMDQIEAVTLQAPNWLHKFLIGRSGCNLKDLQNRQIFINFKDDSDDIYIEGPKEDVIKLAEEMQAKIDELKSTMAIAELQVDPRFHRHIIGRAGANIQRLQDEYKVQIKMPSANLSGTESWEIKIEGDPEGVKNCKKEIESMKIKLENEKTRDVIIKHQYHSHLIGNQGIRIKELRSQYPDVNITFPESSIKSDKVQVRGPKQHVDQIVKKLEKLVEEVIENNYHKEIKIYKQYHKNIIGKGGANIKRIRDENNIRIDFPKENSDIDVISLTGKRDKVEEVARQIEAMQAELISIKDDKLVIPQKFHNTLIGPRGKLIKSIQEECGGVQIQFPSTDIKSDTITIRGPEADVDKAKKKLKELADKNQILSYEDTINIKLEFHKFLVGRKGAALEEFRKKHSVYLIFPDNDDTNKDVIHIVGAKENVIKAKKELEETSKTLENEVERKIKIDHKWHRHFFKRRQFVMEEISRDFGGVKMYFPKADAIENADVVRIVGPKGCIEAAIVRIESIVEDLESQTSMSVFIEQKHHRNMLSRYMNEIKNIQNTLDVAIKFPSKDFVRQESMNESLQNGELGENGHSEEVDENNPVNNVTISGRIENCESAKQSLLDLVPITEDVPLDNEFHKNLIGQKGLEINNFSSKHNVIVNIPQNKNASNKNLDYISIKGPRKNIEEAKERLKEMVSEWEKLREDRILRNFELEVDVPIVFHRNLIGQRGANIDIFRNKFNVNIQMPELNSGKSNVIIRGYESDAVKARDEICSMVEKLQAQRREKLYIPKEIHSYLIGTRGNNLKKLKEQFKCDIIFPNRNAEEEVANYVEVIGDPENIDKCCDYLVERANSLLNDQEDRMPVSIDLTQNQQVNDSAKNSNSSGFIITGAPWQQQSSSSPSQRVPDSNSNEDFPRMLDARGDSCITNTQGPANSCLLNGHSN